MILWNWWRGRSDLKTSVDGYEFERERQEDGVESEGIHVELEAV